MEKVQMDQGKRAGKLLGSRNNRMLVDLKDIIREHALPFLPAKSLYRFNGVCWDWKLQISTPFFAHNQSNSFRTISGVFLQSQSGMPSFVSRGPEYGVPDPSLGFLLEPVDIRSSSNGLLCCQGRSSCRAYYICNPVTKHWKKLPKPNADHGDGSSVVLIFEPSLLKFVAEYKLVCAFPSELGGIEFEIYSSVEGSWRISGEISFGERKLLPTSGVFVNGVVYWASKDRKITAFDLSSERAQVFFSVFGGIGNQCIGVMNGKLCRASTNGKQLKLELLANLHSTTMHMNSRSRMWDRKQVTNFDTSLFDSNRGSHDVVFVCDDFVVIQNGPMLFSYDMKTQTTSFLHEVPESAMLFPYVNSLVEM